MGSDYEKDLIESLKDLNAKSKKLVEEAYKSHMHEAHLCTYASFRAVCSCLRNTTQC